MENQIQFLQLFIYCQLFIFLLNSKLPKSPSHKYQIINNKYKKKTFDFFFLLPFSTMLSYFLYLSPKILLLLSPHLS
jgi:hypothetical protein